jgi:hypothetical protein
MSVTPLNYTEQEHTMSTFTSPIPSEHLFTQEEARAVAQRAVALGMLDVRVTEHFSATLVHTFVVTFLRYAPHTRLQQQFSLPSLAVATPVLDGLADVRRWAESMAGFAR